jgi:hypothetical protein
MEEVILLLDIDSELYKDQIEIAKKVFKGGITRHEIFNERFAEDGADGIPEQFYYPTDDFRDVVEEIIELMPSQFPINGENRDYILEHLFKASNIQGILNEKYLEDYLSGESVLEIILKPSISEGVNYELRLNRIPRENVEIELDLITDEPVKVVYEVEKMVSDINGNNIKATVKKTFTMDTIKLEYFNYFTEQEIQGKPSREVANPFKDEGIFPILYFRGRKEIDSDKTQIPALKLIESQLQLDLLNCTLEEAIAKCAFPTRIIEGTNREWSDVYLSAGDYLALKGSEKYKSDTPSLDVNALDNHMRFKVDKFNKLAGLLEPTLKKEVIKSDSSKQFKLANSELIMMIKNILHHTKKELDKLIKLFLEINGKEYKGENISIPEEILPLDLESIANISTTMINLGIWDKEYVWRTYFPFLTKEDKERIIEAYDNLSELASTGTNVNNIAKPVGNKKQNTMTKEERDIAVTKE